MESNISKVLRAASKDDNQYKQGMKHIMTHMNNKMKEKVAKDVEKRKNAVKIDEDTIRKIVAEAPKFQRVTDPKNPKGNVGPKDENLNFFVTIGTGTDRKIVGDKGFKTREAAERKADALRRQGKSNVRIISKKSTNENTVKVSENTLKQIVSESVKKVLKEGYNQQIVDDAIQAIFSIREKVSKAATQVGFNPEQGNDEVSKLIKQISTLMYQLDRTVNSDYYDSFYSGQD